MFTFGIVMCFISAAIYGIVVYVQIKRIDRLESEQIITTDRLNCCRDRDKSRNSCLANQAMKIVQMERRFDRIERHPVFKPLQMTPVSDFQPGDIHPFTADAFVTTGDQLAEVA